MTFTQRTRRKTIPLGSQSKGTTNPLVWDIPKTGILGSIMLYITATVTGTLSAPNAYGAASIVRRVRLFANSGIDLINISGPGYHWMLRNFVNDYKDPVPFSDARNAVTVTTFNLSMFLPVALNLRDPIGLFMLQNEQTLLQLSVEFEADATVATGATVTATVTPIVEVFTVPIEDSDLPDFSLIQQIVEDDRVISGAGEYEYRWPRGANYLQTIHGFTPGPSGADSWSAAKLRINSVDYLANWVPATLNVEYGAAHGLSRVTGVIPFDLVGLSGLGMFGSARDVINSAAVTELESVLTLTGSGTLKTIRRQLVPLEG